MTPSDFYTCYPTMKPYVGPEYRDGGRPGGATRLLLRFSRGSKCRSRRSLPTAPGDSLVHGPPRVLYKVLVQ